MNKFMKVALKEATKGINAHEGGPFGCVIVKDGKIIARAHNQVLKKNDATCHGEIEAIRKASKKLKSFDLSGCELYTTGEPCPMCLGAILWAKIDKVYFGSNIKDTELIGFDDKKFYETFLHKETILNELDRDECLKLYEQYSKIENKKHY